MDSAVEYNPALVEYFRKVIEYVIDDNSYFLFHKLNHNISIMAIRVLYEKTCILKVL